MKVGNLIKLNGNLNRIDEMVRANLSYSAMSKAFAKDGIEISADRIKTMSKGIDILSKQTLSKKTTRRIIKETQKPIEQN